MFGQMVRVGVGADGVGAVGAVGSLVGSARALAGVDVSGLSDGEVVGVLARVEAARRALDAVCLGLVAEVDVRGLAMERSGHRTAAWLGVEFGWPAARARSEVRVGRTLRSTLPEVGSALAGGRINADHARVICRAANPRVEQVIAGAQQELIALAKEVRFERFRDDVMALADLADGDGGHDPRPEDNSLSVADGPAGALFLKGTLVGEWAATVRDALTPMTDRMFRRHRSDREQCPELAAPTRSQLRAEALVELVRRGHAADTTATRAPVADVTLVMHTPGTAVHPSVELLASRVGTCTGVSGIRYPNRTIELLCCDAVFHTLVVDSLGVPLDLGTGVRLATDHQRRAAAVRDGGCVFPGCDTPPSWTDLHHVRHHAAHGPTDMANLASLCRHHHGIVHRRGWAMTYAPDQWFTITTPGGDTLNSQRHGRQRE